MSQPAEKVLLAMSGGVDSSVAAYLLRESGYEVTGVFLCLGRSVGIGHDTTGCCSPADAADARRVAEVLGIELYTLDAARDFARIIDYFADEYARGRTPNPCVRCNTLVKLPKLIARADAVGTAYVATGHHARIVDGGIRRCGDKDQSYALFEIPRRHLGRLLLPIGEHCSRGGGKVSVRRIAAELGLPVAEKPDSQEICFVDGDYADLLRARRSEALRPGDIIDAAGNILGTHDGVGRFTVGQRRGLGIAAAEPLYVTRIDPAAATVTVGPKESVLGSQLSASSANWQIDPPPAGSEFDAIVQIRYNHEGAAGKVRITDEGAFEVSFEKPVAAITPGQAAVIYDRDRLLGGGWID